MARLTKAQQAERDEAITHLRELLKPGDTVYTILRHVSKSGMSRVIQLVVMKDKDDHRYIGFSAARAMGDTYDREREGIKVGGCGMDMGFSVVYNLGRVLWPEGFTLAPGQHGRNGDTSGFDADGGYALRQRWL